MNSRDDAMAAVVRVLRTPSDDIGCMQTMDELPGYVDTVSISRGSGDGRHEKVGAHLHACGPCWDNYRGLLAAVST
jgi:hypothetical protein